MNCFIVSPFVIVLFTEVIYVYENPREAVRIHLQDRARLVSDPHVRNELLGLVFENASDAMLVLFDGRFVECNKAAVELMGLESKEGILGKTPADFSPFLQPDESVSEEKARSMLQIAARSGSVSFEWLHTKKNGATLRVEVRILHIIFKSKDCFLVFWKDTTSLRVLENRLSSLSENLPGMLFQVRVFSNGESSISYLGGKIPFLFGYSAGDFPMPLERFFWGVHSDDLPRILRTVGEARAGQRHWQCEYRLCLPDGRILWVEGNAFPVRDIDGSVVWHGYLADITQRKDLEEQVKEQLHLQEQIFDLIPVPLVLKDGNSRFLQVNLAFADFLNLPKESILGKGPYEVFPPELASMVFDEDRELLRSGMLRMDLERKVKDGRGRNMWLKSYKAPIFNNSGAIVGIVGGNMDITAVKDAEAALRESEERWKFALEGAGDGVWDWNLKTGDVFYSNQLKAMLGYREEDISNRFEEWERLLHPEDSRKFKRAIDLVLLGETVAFTCEFRMLTKDGNWRWILARGKAVEVDASNVPTRIIGTNSDITERKWSEALIHHQATHDMLTNLPNRPLFNDRLTLAMAEAQRSGKKLAVIFLDLDNFKNVNDMMGHVVGDQLLLQAAERIRGEVRDMDTVARMGGDEFTFLIPLLTDRSEAEDIARRVSNVLSAPFIVEGTQFNISGSMGIALFPDDGTDDLALMKHADMAMYEAKKAGKNTWRFWS